MRVLITDGETRTALAAARSLVRAGHQVFVAAPSRRALAAVARGVTPLPLRRDPLGDPAGFAAGVAGLAARHDIGLLLPVTDASVESLLAHRAVLPPGAVLPFPATAAYREASDKAEVRRRAAAAGFTVPESRLLAGPADALPGPGFFPAVLKPHRSVVRAGAGSVKVGVEFVADAPACRRALAALPAGAYPVLLQQRVSGAGEGLFVLRWDGRIVAEFAHRRLREKPPAGGVSVYCESVAADPALVTAGRALVESLDWRGVAMIECKRDARTGRHVLMEVNGRLWGSLQLAIDAGVDFPALLAACAAGAAPAATPRYRVGVRSRWFWGDVDHLYLRLTRSAAALHLEGDHPSRWSAIRNFLRRRPGDRDAVWRWRDPLPAVIETLERLGLG